MAVLEAQYRLFWNCFAAVFDCPKYIVRNEMITH